MALGVFLGIISHFMRITLFSLALVAVGIFSSCSKKELKTSDGFAYTLDKHADGARQAKAGDLLTFHVVYRTAKDSILGTSYQQGAPYTIPLDTARAPGQPKDPFFSCYMALAEGDSARFEVPSDSLFKGAAAAQRPPFLPVGSMLRVAMRALRLESKADRDSRVAKELTDMATKGKFEAQAGIYVRLDKTGTGPVGHTNDTLTVHYTGFFADPIMGKKPFDSSVNPPQPGRPAEPFKMVLNTHSVIAGWDSAFSHMPEGSKGQILIPYALAYGEQGNPGGIPPYSNLIFDVELLKVTKGVPAPVVSASK